MGKLGAIASTFSFHYQSPPARPPHIRMMTPEETFALGISSLTFLLERTERTRYRLNRLHEFSHERQCDSVGDVSAVSQKTALKGCLKIGAEESALTIVQNGFGEASHLAIEAALRPVESWRSIMDGVLLSNYYVHFAATFSCSQAMMRSHSTTP